MPRALRFRAPSRPVRAEPAEFSDHEHPSDIESDEAIVVPRAAEPPQPPPFPLIGSLAPLGVAAAVWLILQSPLALVFALLSPVMAVASMLDGRRSTRRSRRREKVKLLQRRDDFRRRVESFHAREVEALRRAVPSAAALVAHPVDVFTAGDGSGFRVNLGAGTLRSTLRVEGGTGEAEEPDRRLRAFALALPDAPVLAPAPCRIAVVGAGPLAHALARGYAVQLAAAASPERVEFACRGNIAGEAVDEWSWVAALPHSGPEVVQFGSVGETHAPLSESFVVVAETVERVPPEASVVVVAQSAAAVGLLRHPSLDIPFSLAGDFVSVVQAAALTDTLSAQARAIGRIGDPLPERVLAAQLRPVAGMPATHERAAVSDRLVAEIGIGEAGRPSRIDLVAEGPHAVIGGTTGSGKSELLVTWVSQLARSYAASEFTVLLVDFKGGAAFDPLTELDHCVGLITDLDPGAAERALSSLQAEIRWRETTLRDHGARDVSDEKLAGRLARLVIVVDEFAAMLRDFPQLHDVFADIAARGRSLGMHLILCTQRPAGVVRDALLANCELRLSLRVNNAADSTAIIGSPAASTLSPTIRGRCYVAKGGARPELVQVAYTDPATIASSHSERAVHVRTPWLPPLPPRLMLDGIPRPSNGLILGLLDLPEQQSQPSAVFVPAEHGHLLVLGSARAGKTTLLDSLNRQHPNARRIGGGVERAWDELRDLAALCRQRRKSARAAGDTIVLIDDVDSVLREFEPDYQAEMLAELTQLLRDGPSIGITLVATAQRLAAPLSALAPLFSERILLRFSNRQDYLVAEGLSADYDPRLPAGAGHWRGSRVQLAIPPLLGDHDQGAIGVSHETFVDSADGAKRRSSEPGALLVVTPRPGDYLDGSNPDLPAGTRLVDASDRTSMSATALRPHDHVWMIATPDAWLAAWATFSLLRGTIPVRFDRCSLSDFRALTRRRELPPPVERGHDARWLLTPDGTISRC